MSITDTAPFPNAYVASIMAADIFDRHATTHEGDVLPAVAETRELVNRARDGDPEAYALLFDRFHDELYRFAARRLRDPAAGQDVASETFADAFAGIHRFAWRGVPFEAWLYTIARRRIADRQRARSSADVLVADPPPGVEQDRSSSVLDRIHVRALIERLPETERDVIELRFMEELDVEQTAARLGKTAGAVRVAQHRGLGRLRKLMQEEST